jgi:hypothetical protein
MMQGASVGPLPGGAQLFVIFPGEDPGPFLYEYISYLLSHVRAAEQRWTLCLCLPRQMEQIERMKATKSWVAARKERCFFEM